MDDVIIEKHEDWTRQNPVWRVSFPVSLPPQKFIVPGLDLSVNIEYAIGSVTIVGKLDAEKIAKRLKDLLHDTEND